MKKYFITIFFLKVIIVQEHLYGMDEPQSQEKFRKEFVRSQELHNKIGKLLLFKTLPINKQSEVKTKAFNDQKIFLEQEKYKLEQEKYMLKKDIWFFKGMNFFFMAVSFATIPAFFLIKK